MQTILGKKIGQTQKFLSDGTRVPVTQIQVPQNHVMSVKTLDRDGYVAVQLGAGIKNRPTKSELGYSKKGANLETAPNFLREVRFSSDAKSEELPKTGEVINASMVLEAGDMVDVVGISKGKGFAGGVKRHGFHGGPKTHGQSDRHRAPGSIGQTTTPGRVYKGKRMAGKMGNDTVTVKNLQIIDVSDDLVLVSGQVPGKLGANIVIKKIGKNKKFVGLFKEEKPEEKTTAPEVVKETKVEETKPEAKEAQASAVQKPETETVKTEAASTKEEVKKEEVK